MKKETPIFSYQVIDRDTFETVGYDNLYATGWSIAGQGGIRRFCSNEKDSTGQLIYDKDILLCNDVYYQVTFMDGGFWVSVGEECTNLTSYTAFDIPYDFDEVSVVGNMYSDKGLWDVILSDQRNSTLVGSNNDN